MNKSAADAAMKLAREWMMRTGGIVHIKRDIDVTAHDIETENLVLDARLYHIPPDEAKARIDELVKRFGLEDHMDALAESLPMGLRQRLSLAVAVLHKPQILILDEPTSGVDPVARRSRTRSPRASARSRCRHCPAGFRSGSE